MHKITFSLLVLLLAASCVRAQEKLVLGKPPLEVCNSFLKKEGLTRSDGADFETLAWQFGAAKIFIYVGLHPKFPGMEEIRKNAVVPSEPILLKRVGSESDVQSLYAYPTAYGFRGYAHVSITGPVDEAAELANRIEEGFQLCESGLGKGG